MHGFMNVKKIIVSVQDETAFYKVRMLLLLLLLLLLLFISPSLFLLRFEITDIFIRINVIVRIMTRRLILKVEVEMFMTINQPMNTLVPLDIYIRMSQLIFLHVSAPNDCPLWTETQILRYCNVNM
jgi:hypothetical protein